MDQRKLVGSGRTRQELLNKFLLHTIIVSDLVHIRIINCLLLLIQDTTVLLVLLTTYVMCYSLQTFSTWLYTNIKFGLSLLPTIVLANSYNNFSIPLLTIIA